MNNSTSAPLGGLVLKSQELLNILSETDSVGLAFGLATPGVATDVNLLVYKVKTDGIGNLVGEVRNVVYKKGAPGLGELANDITSFQFEHLAVLQASGFGFAYIRKVVFEELFSDGEEEAFIAGATMNQGTLGTIQNEWFSLSITPRHKPGQEMMMGAAPKVELMAPCPPVWIRNLDDSKESKGGPGNLSFRKA